MLLDTKPVPHHNTGKDRPMATVRYGSEALTFSDAFFSVFAELVKTIALHDVKEAHKNTVEQPDMESALRKAARELFSTEQSRREEDLTRAAHQLIQKYSSAHSR